MSSARKKLEMPGLRTRSRRTGEWHYQTETLRPIVCLLYVLPFLLIYELGVIFLDNQSIRNGLDVWLGSFLEWVGVGELLLLPLLTTFILFAMHHFKGDRWSVSPVVLLGMVIESFGLALIILWAAKAQHLFLMQYSDHSSSLPLLQVPAHGQDCSLASQFVSFCGAGLYEELVFRLLMLPGLVLLLMKAGLKQVPAATLAVVVTSLLFAGAHYDVLNPAAGPFELPGFMVRVVASVFFCLVFLLRGFGVAVGTHVAYDVLTQF